MPARPDLVFDLGVCNGDDSAYYLHRGYSVVAVEPNPILLPRLRERFDREIREGRYELVGMGITESEGEAVFWVCDDKPEWSSFDRSIANRYGARHHGVEVRTCRFRSLLEKYGTPLYCKIDIEGNDNLCLDDLCGDSRPQYLSIEMSAGNGQIDRLRDLGYTRFKIISQRTLRQPGMVMAKFKAGLPALLRHLVTAAEAKLIRYRSDGEWKFSGGYSGPFGENTPGRWISYEEAIDLRQLLERGSDLSEWHDIHAALPQLQ